MKHYTLLYYIILFLAACAESTDDFSAGQDLALPISIEATYPTQAPTRATMENGFVDGDAIGLFVADYDSEGNATTPALKGDRTGNIRFTYDGSRWTANYQPYWKNSHTPADFYGYYPYDQQLESVTEYAFTVSRRQDSEASGTAIAGYEQSDLLWAKAEHVTPTTDAIAMKYRHLMAGINIQLEQGSGFTAGEWDNLGKTVLVESTILSGAVNLQTGIAIVGSGSATAITPLLHQNVYRAVVFPQTVSAGKTLVSVTVDGRTYPLTKNDPITYLGGKMHNMTITINKSEDTGNYTLMLKADNVTAWIDDPDLHDGLVRQYTIVSLTDAGTLQQQVDKVCDDYSKLASLKIIGPLNNDDLDFIRWSLTNLRDVNMAKATIEDGHLWGFDYHSRLQHFVFPEKSVLYIDDSAFGNCSLMGDLVIPEGVLSIGSYAFADNGMRGSLSLPSTLRSINSGAFAFNGFTGELRLPESIEYIYEGGYSTFQGCDFEGSLYLPPSLKTLPLLGFGKMTGTIVIPPAITEIIGLGFAGSGCSQVEFHDGVTSIGGGAFRDANLQGELVLPPNLKKLSDHAFQRTKISNIVFNDGLRIIGDGAFCECRYLTGILRFPSKVARVPGGCFEGCTALTGLVLPADVDVIGAGAFRECYSLASIVCENPEPPVVLSDAFLGVPKDNFTVEVPRGCVEKYREAEGWKEFKRIAEYSSFVCRPQAACALNNAHSEQLIINADGAWQVERKPEWVTVSPSSGTGKMQLTLTIRQMAHGEGNRQDSIIFTMPAEGHRTFCAVSQYDYEHEEDSYIALQQHSRGHGIDIVFLGDGYDGEDISNGSYLSLVTEQTEHFFDLEPYRSHRDFFNVYVAFPLSQEKGVNTMNTYVNNHFGTLYGYDGLMCTSNQLLCEIDDVRQYAVDHTPLTQDNLGSSLIILVPNSDAYEGVTYFEWYGSPVSICPPSNRPYPQDTRGVVQHEAGGHGFGRLADETIVKSAWAPADVKNDVVERQSRGEYENLSIIGSLHSVPWADMVFDQRYSDQVDVFEGALGYMRGIFRPEQNSCMNYGIPYYNAPSRLSIMRRIFSYAWEPFDMDYFYSHDSNTWGSTGDASRQTRGGNTVSGNSYAASNQHHAPLTVSGKTIGNKVRSIRERTKTK